MNKALANHIADGMDGAVGQLRAAADNADAVGKIDWTNFRAFLALLIEKLVPIIIPLIVAKLDPALNKFKEDKTE